MKHLSYIQDSGCLKVNSFGVQATSKVADLPRACLHCAMHFITLWCNSTTQIVETPQVRASNSFYHVGVSGHSRGVQTGSFSNLCS